MRSILVHVTGDRIGDALLKWPAIAGLKQAAPELDLIWVAGRRTSVFKGPLAALANIVFSEVHDQAGIGVVWSEILRPVSAPRADVVIATEPKLRDAILVKRIPHRLFISPAFDFRLSDRRPEHWERLPRSVTGRMKRLFELALGRAIELHNEVPLSEDLRASAARALPSGRRYIGLSPGAGGVRKRWPLQRFIALARALQSSNRTPVFFLGPEETALINDINKAVPAAIMPEVELASAANSSLVSGPLFTIALAERLTASVANDAGGGHLLAAGRQPLISLYGHTDPDKFRPPYGRHVALTTAQFGGGGMEAIPVEAVLAELDKLCPPATSVVEP